MTLVVKIVYLVVTFVKEEKGDVDLEMFDDKKKEGCDVSMFD